MVNELMLHLEKVIARLNVLYGEPVIFPSLGVATFSSYEELTRIIPCPSDNKEELLKISNERLN
jgi:hypothetical protein